MGALPQALEIILEVQRTSSDEKIARKISFSPHKTCFFSFFFSLDPPTFKASNFFILGSF
jgi:hypothetical protein